MHENRNQLGGMCVEYGIISIIPVTVLIVGVLITKKMPEMILLSSAIGAIIIHKSNFLTGYIEMAYSALNNSSYQFLLFILIGFGAMIKLFEESGALLGFSKLINRFASTAKRSLVLTWILGAIIFIDDYLNALAVAASMRKITDGHGVPREHLAYTINTMGACVCVLIPFSSWAAFGIATISEFDLGFSDYLAAIPFMFYPWTAIIICLLLALGIIPKMGNMKKAYIRVETEGLVAAAQENEVEMVKISDTDVKASSPWNFLIPIIVLIVTMLYFDNELIHGIIAALVSQAILYLPQKLMKPSEFINNIFEGVQNMANLAFIIGVAFILVTANDIMGFSNYVIQSLSGFVAPSILPALVFLIVAFVAFAAASFWALIVITVPIFVPLAVEMSINPAVVVAAIMSGVAFGSQCCLYSDAVFMTAAGTGVSNVVQIKSIAPYVIIGAAISTILFLITGFIL